MLRMGMFLQLRAERSSSPLVGDSSIVEAVKLTASLHSGMNSVWRLLLDVTYPIVAYTTVSMVVDFLVRCSADGPLRAMLSTERFSRYGFTLTETGSL